MNTITHVTSASLIALTAANVKSDETHYIYLALISAGIIDIDHLVLYFRKRPFFKQNSFTKNLHHARSSLHELPGIIFFASLFFVVSLFNLKLALILFLPIFIHLIQDYLVGISYPFYPLDKQEVRLTKHSTKTAYIMNIVIILISGILWKLYLQAPVLAIK